MKEITCSASTDNKRIHANTNKTKLNQPPVTSKDIRKDKIMKLANVCKIMAEVRKAVRLICWFIV